MRPVAPFDINPARSSGVSRARAGGLWERWLFRIALGLAVALSAALLFLAEPLVAKEILPWFGGSAVVWTTALLFFQALLLAGYAYAYALARVRRRGRAALLHTAVLLAGLVSLPLLPPGSMKPSGAAAPVPAILLILLATVGLPYFGLAATSPLLGQWLANRSASASHSEASSSTGAHGVYRLFALSNAGSLVGLLAYPFVIEPHWSIPVQAHAWTAGYTLFLAACVFSVLSLARSRPPVASDFAGDPAGDRAARAAPVPAPTCRRRMLWLVLAAEGSVLLMSMTHHLTQNIASIPFLWVVPLVLYLASFVVVFEGRNGRGWYSRKTIQPAAVIAAVTLAWALSAHNGVLPLGLTVPLYCGGLFVLCWYCHGELAAARPDPAHLSLFYLLVAAGGALGGVLVAVVAPLVFNGFWETPLALAAVALTATLFVYGRPQPWPAWRQSAALAAGSVIAALLLVTWGALPRGPQWMFGPATEEALVARGLAGTTALALCVGFWWLGRRFQLAQAIGAFIIVAVLGTVYHDAQSERAQYMTRDFYGAMRVRLRDAGTPMAQRTLVHGTILHGAEFVDAAKRDLPLTYYGYTSGIGRTLTSLRPPGVPLRVGSIGLGTGTLAAYGRSGDRYTIYELDPAVVPIAEDWFHYLRDSHAQTAIVLGDARLSLERELAAGRFNDPLQRFDVLSVDAFSSDAIPTHLLTREALAVYIRAVRPDGVIAFHTSNRFLDLPPIVAQLAEAAGYTAVAIEDQPTDTDRYAPSEWVLVTRNRDFLAQPSVRSVAQTIAVPPGLSPWTDQYNNLFEILRHDARLVDVF